MEYIKTYCPNCDGDHRLTGFISEKLNSFVLELRIPFRSGYCPECEYKKDLINILKLLLIEEEL